MSRAAARLWCLLFISRGTCPVLTQEDPGHTAVVPSQVQRTGSQSAPLPHAAHGLSSMWHDTSWALASPRPTLPGPSGDSVCAPLFLLCFSVIGDRWLQPGAREKPRGSRGSLMGHTGLLHSRRTVMVSSTVSPL